MLSRVERKAAEKKEKELARREEAKAKKAQGRKGRDATFNDVKQAVCGVEWSGGSGFGEDGGVLMCIV